MNPGNLVFAPVVLPLLGSALALSGRAFLSGRGERAAEFLGAGLGLFLPGAVLFLMLPSLLAGEVWSGVVGGWSEGVGIAYTFDGLAWLVNLLGFTVAGAAWVYSLGAGPRGSAFTAVFLIQTAALAATAMTADLFNLFVCLEVMGLASYILVAASRKPGAYLASFSYLMVSATAMILFLLGVYGFYRLTGSLSYRGIARGLAALEDGGGAAAMIALALTVSAVALRVAVMPLYGWLPDAHASAPHAVSAVLSGVLIKTPLFALARILLILPAGARAGEILGYAGAVTALAAVLIALSQKDAKRLLAYHSISQIGYVVCAWGGALTAGLESPAGLLLMTAAFLHALFHALFKGLLFLTVGTVTDQAGERNVYRLRGGAGLMRRAGEGFPVTLITFTAAAMAISALPPMNGFVSKTVISHALGGGWEYWLLTLAGAGTAASFIKLSRIFWPVRRGEEKPEPAAGISRPGWAVWLSQLFLGGLCLAGGLTAPWLIRGTAQLLGGGAAAGVSAVTAEGFSLPLYVPKVLGKTAGVTAAGVLLFGAALTTAGRGLLRVIRERPRSYHGLFTSLALGLAGMALWLLAA